MRISDWSSDVCSSDLYARSGAADATGRNDEFGIGQLLCDITRDNGESIPEQPTDDYDQQWQRIADDRDDDQRNQDDGQREPDRQNEIDQQIDRSAPVTGRDPETCAENAGDEDCWKSDEQ